MEKLNEGTERQLSAKELEKLIFISFLHSQGEPELQEKLIRWLTAYYGAQSEDKFDEAYDMFSKNNLTPGDAFKLSEKHLHTATHSDITKAKIGDKIGASGVSDQEWYVNILIEEGNKNNLTDSVFLKSIIEYILNQDLIYLTHGRPNRKNLAASDTLADPFFSFSVHYLLRLNKTSNAALDALYKKLHECLEDEQISNKLKTAISLYNEHHPDNIYDVSSIE